MRGCRSRCGCFVLYTKDSFDYPIDAVECLALTYRVDDEEAFAVASGESVPIPSLKGAQGGVRPDVGL